MFHVLRGSLAAGGWLTCRNPDACAGKMAILKSQYVLCLTVQNTDAPEIDEILRKYRSVAVVGLSKDQSRDSYRVAKYLADRGFDIIPVNPTADTIMGRRAYPSLTSIPDDVKSRIEIVDVFRPSNEVSTLVDEAVSMKRSAGRPFVIWLQLGIRDDQAARRASEEGITVIQDRCMMIEAAAREKTFSARP
jgi:predicted CoA-binding protein